MKIQGQSVYSVHTQTTEKCKEIKHLQIIQHGPSTFSPLGKDYPGHVNIVFSFYWITQIKLVISILDLLHFRNQSQNLTGPKLENLQFLQQFKQLLSTT